MTKIPETKSPARGRMVSRAIAAALFVTCTFGVEAGTSEEDAKAILKGMTDYLAAQQAISIVVKPFSAVQSATSLSGVPGNGAVRSPSFISFPPYRSTATQRCSRELRAIASVFYYLYLSL